jgi:solute carrier family 35 protein
MVSATTFTLVGVVNKFGTVLLNVLLWDKHSSGMGILAVCVCLVSGSFYQQAPKREEARKPAHQQEQELPLMRAESGSGSGRK